MYYHNTCFARPGDHTSRARAFLSIGAIGATGPGLPKNWGLQISKYYAILQAFCQGLLHFQNFFLNFPIFNLHIMNIFSYVMLCFTFCILCICNLSLGSSTVEHGFGASMVFMAQGLSKAGEGPGC